MASNKQRAAARRHIKKAAGAAKRKRTISKLPNLTRTALGKEGAKAAKHNREELEELTFGLRRAHCRTRLVKEVHMFCCRHCEE